MEPYLIIGATGQVGRHAAQALLAHGAALRVLVRSEENASSWRCQGVEVVIGDLSNVDALKEAFNGVAGAFIMTPTWFESQDMFEQNRNALIALKEATTAYPPAKVVLLSSIGAQHTEGTGAIVKLNRMEQAFTFLPNVTSIRAAWFMENYLGMIESVQTTGTLPSMLSPLDRKIPMVATADIGTWVARTLLDVWSGQRIVPLEGPERYSPDDVASAIGNVLTPTFRSWGLTTRSAEAMKEMIEAFNSGLITFETDCASSVKGQLSLETVIANRLAQ